MVAGIGFVGGGAIVRDGKSVHGTATAASIWNTGAIGAAAQFVTLQALVPIKKHLDKSPRDFDDGKN